MLLTSFPTTPPLPPFRPYPSPFVVTDTTNLKSARAVEVAFLGRLIFYISCWPPAAKSSGRHHLSLKDEEVSRLTVCRRPINYRISSHFGETGETLISGFKRKGTTLRTLVWAVTSLWPQKVVWSHVYSARAKLMQIADQARDLV